VAPRAPASGRRWSAVDDATIVTLRARGAKLREIAAALGRHYSTTAGRVAMLVRNGMVPRAYDRRSHTGPAPRLAPSTKPEPVRIVRVDLASLERRPTLSWARGCQWIAGTPTGDDDCKCGAPLYGGSYCAEHYARAYSSRARGSKVA